MKPIKTVLLCMIAIFLTASFAFAAGDVEEGKALFNDPKLGTNGSTCNMCHPDGKGLEKAGAQGKVSWKTPAGTATSLEDAINICITVALKGTALDKKSSKMQDLVAYIKSLGKKSMNTAPGY